MKSFRVPGELQWHATTLDWSGVYHFQKVEDFGCVLKRWDGKDWEMVPLSENTWQTWPAWQVASISAYPFG